ncbi:MAG TPA: alternative ribosome rescue aminoacyl-tRNA hydrolase ArfB [Thermoanaerobaculia bacterium]|nr:alternative ribosome rescue aminoacyl-tRNA hydrolase ArfB [Thermoanaerobaculia bacterium]HUM31068.1 alternative ribosome rescue aminoacyl-tRNA hydrolase ArfB [Thermoanaerobaculia bacterium]HXK69420.1 alternative ribosome rescue aminoacyl-tRNA hydrolase ArfB [Thermoanaerobaculia bacterium]
MIVIQETLALEEKDLQETFVRSSGPGGQHVNKASTCVQLKFDVMGCAVLSDIVKERLIRLAGRRMGADGFLTITARRYRDRERNREDARERLAALVRKALEEPRPRKKTRPGSAARERRLESKRRRAQLKESRKRPDTDP